MADMPMEQDDAGSASSEQVLDLHPNFSTKRPGDIILRSDDNRSFYFRLAQLAELSSFFSTLPPPSSDDLVDGTPLVPLHGATSLGLYVTLTAIQSTTSPEPFHLSRRSMHPNSYEKAVLEAAVLARKYDLSIVFRLLVEGTAKEVLPGYRYCECPFLTFDIWALGNIESQLQDAACETFGDDVSPISCVDDIVAEMCKTHAPIYWMQLLDFHLRHSQSMAYWRHRLTRSKNYTEPFPVHDGECEEKSGPMRAGMKVRDMLWGAKTVREVSNISDECFGLGCEWCMEIAEERYGELVTDLQDFATSYIRKKS